MSGFGKSSHSDLERSLREQRSQPRDELVERVVGEIQSQTSRPRQGRRFRTAVSLGFAVGLLALIAALGGFSSSGTISAAPTAATVPTGTAATSGAPASGTAASSASAAPSKAAATAPSAATTTGAPDAAASSEPAPAATDTAKVAVASSPSAGGDRRFLSLFGYSDMMIVCYPYNPSNPVYPVSYANWFDLWLPHPQGYALIPPGYFGPCALQ